MGRVWHAGLSHLACRALPFFFSPCIQYFTCSTVCLLNHSIFKLYRSCVNMWVWSHTLSIRRVNGLKTTSLDPQNGGGGNKPGTAPVPYRYEGSSWLKLSCLPATSGPFCVPWSLPIPTSQPEIVSPCNHLGKPTGQLLQVEACFGEGKGQGSLNLSPVPPPVAALGSVGWNICATPLKIVSLSLPWEKKKEWEGH